MIEWELLTEGESKTLEEVPVGAEITAVDGKVFKGVCGKNGCDGWMLSTSFVSCECDKCGHKHDMIDDLI